MSLVEIMPLGGAGEIGRNATVVRQGEDMILVDCGISFPNEEMPGVDVVIPDFEWLKEHQHQFKAVFLTHAHEDHVGALSFLLQDINVPVYATDFTHAMIRHKLHERLDTRGLKLVHIEPGQFVEVGELKMELIHVTHSIPDNCALAVHTIHGVVLFTGDFKFDFTPVDGKLSQIGRLTELAREGVVCLLSDSTNVVRPGWGPSESIVTEGFRRAFQKAEGRILITMFASNIHRMQQAMDVAHEMGRKVAVAGRRMEQTIDVCSQLGILNLPKGIRIRLDMADEYEPSQVVILTTGSQGEPMSALVQMSRGEYSRMRVRAGDTVIYSARPIPGNEAAIWRCVNRLFLLGATVEYDTNPPVHVSGHAYQEELKMMINLTKPFYLVPIHGEPRHQHAYCELAALMGHPLHRMFQLRDGHMLILDDTKAWTQEITEGGQLWVDDGGHIVDRVTVRERAHLADGGVVVVLITVGPGGAEPVRVEARGFSGPEKALLDAAQAADDALSAIPKRDLGNHELVKSTAQEAVRTILLRKTQLRPVILPLVTMP